MASAALAVFAQRLHLLVDHLVAHRIDVGKRQVFQLAANLAHAEAVGQRRVNLQRLLGDLQLALGRKVLQGAHVVQAVGQLDEHHADVVHHGQHHLAHVFRLRFLARGEIDLADLGDALDDVGHLLAELLLQLLDGERGVFDGIVQQSGGDGRGVQLHLGQQNRHFQGMHQVGLAGGALLSAVMLEGDFVGAADDVEIVVGAVGAGNVPADRGTVSRSKHWSQCARESSP